METIEKMSVEQIDKQIGQSEKLSMEQTDKQIDQLGKMSVEELEAISDNTSVNVPVDLAEKIENTVIASELIASELDADRKRKTVKPDWKRALWIASSALVAASVAAIVVSVRAFSLSQPPQDSCSSPEEAYAKVEEAFSMISSKTEKAVYLTDAAFPEMNRASKILETMNR